MTVADSLPRRQCSTNVTVEMSSAHSNLVLKESVLCYFQIPLLSYSSLDYDYMGGSRSQSARSPSVTRILRIINQSNRR